MISRVFIERPKLAMVISLITVLAGFLCLRTLPIAEYPEIAPPTVQVSANYPGASGQVIADTIASVIEKEMNGLEDLEYFSSKSNNSGNYTLTLTFASGTDGDMAQVNTQNAVSRAEPSLPSEVVALGVTVKKRSTDILAVYSFQMDESSNMSLLDLSNYVSDNILDPISRLEGVSDVEIMGERVYSMRIWIDPLRLSSLNIMPEEVISAIQTQNIQAAAGSVGAEGSNKFIELKVNTKGRLQSVEEFENIVVKVGENGTMTRLGDFARVELGTKNFMGDGTLNGNHSIAMGLYRNNGGNAVEIVDKVNAFLKSMEPKFPKGFSYIAAYDPTEYIRTTMSEIAYTLVLTLVLVVLITYIFLQDWRATLIPSIAIPVSLMGTFLFLSIFGFTINVLTMFALILVIGSLVDDAIVVVENCMRIIEEEHLSPKDAAIKSMQQITGAIFATTLVTVAIYAPVGFYGGMVGTIYLQFSVTMCIALCLSTFNAMTLSPALCALLLRPHVPTRNPLFKGFNFGLNLTKKGYLKISNLMVRKVILTVILLVGLIFANKTFFDNIQSGFVPDEDKGVVMCDVSLAPGASIARTQAVQREAYELIKNIPGVKNAIQVSGMSLISGVSENGGLIIITLDPWDERKTPDLQVYAIKSKIDAALSSIAEARVNTFVPPAIMGLGMTGGVSFVLQASGGETTKDLETAMYKLLMKINQLPEVAMAFSTFNASTPQLYFDLNAEKAEVMDVPVSRVYTTLQGKLASIYVNDFNLNGNSYQVKIQADKESRGAINDIGQILIRSNSGKMVPASALGTVDYMIGPRQVERFNQLLSAAINVQLKPNISTGGVMDKIEKLVQENLSQNYRVSWTDMSYQERGNDGKIFSLMLMAVLFGYLFLVAQYESWTTPIPVVASVSFATLGGLLGLWLMKMPLTIYAQLGLIMLIGLSAKNAILMIEFSKQERERGSSLVDAAQNGLNQRYRAVLMTAWSFLIGVFPMVIATGAGAGSRVAIGVTTFYGMLLATVVGITFVPGMYALFQGAREFIKGKRKAD